MFLPSGPVFSLNPVTLYDFYQLIPDPGHIFQSLTSTEMILFNQGQDSHMTNPS